MILVLNRAMTSIPCLIGPKGLLMKMSTFLKSIRKILERYQNVDKKVDILKIGDSQTLFGRLNFTNEKSKFMKNFYTTL